MTLANDFLPASSDSYTHNFSLGLTNFYISEQGWAANSTPGIYQWHLPVFTGLENTPQVANTGKYRQIEIFLVLKNCRSL